MAAADWVARLRDCKAHKIVVISNGREPEEIAHNPGRWRALEKRLGAGDVMELQGYDKTGILVARIPTVQVPAATIPSGGATSAGPAGRTATQDAAPRNTAGPAGIDPEAQRFRAFVEGQQVILSQFQAMLDPIFRGFSNVTESLAHRVAQLEAQAAEAPEYYQEAPAEPESKSQVDELAGQVLAGVASTMGITPGGQK